METNRLFFFDLIGAKGTLLGMAYVSFCCLVGVSLVIKTGHIVFWEIVFGSFMISRPDSGYRHWLEFVGMLL